MNCSSGRLRASVDAVPQRAMTFAVDAMNAPASSPPERAAGAARRRRDRRAAAAAPGRRPARGAAWPARDIARRRHGGTLEALALLGADGDTVAAAILHAYPGAARAAGAALEHDFAAVAALLDGQRAAEQVWALHAEHGGKAGSEGLRRLLLAIVRDLRVVPILLARQLARMRAADRLPEDAAPRTGRADPRHPRAARQPARHLAAEVGAGGPRVPLPASRRPTSRSRACSTRSAATASATSSRSSARCARRWPRRA